MSEPEKVEVWSRAPYGARGYSYIPLEIAREALERGGYETRFIDGELQYKVMLDPSDPQEAAMLRAIMQNSKSMVSISGVVKRGKT